MVSKEYSVTYSDGISVRKVTFDNEENAYDFYFAYKKRGYEVSKPKKVTRGGYRRMPRLRKLANGKIIMDGSPIGFVAEYCPMCDGPSVVTYVDPEFTNFKCTQCGKTWYRPTHTVEFDGIRGTVQPDLVNTIAGAYQTAVKKASKTRRNKTTSMKKTTPRRRSHAKKTSKKK
jgi:hypothetical protein